MSVSDCLIKAKAKGGFTKTLRNKKDDAEMWQYIVDAVYWFIMHVTVHMYTKVSPLTLPIVVNQPLKLAFDCCLWGQDEEESRSTHI
jgi:hypothetical protein